MDHARNRKHSLFVQGIVLTIVLLVFVLQLTPAEAALTGSVNSVDKWAWSENIGWIDFCPGGTPPEGVASCVNVGATELTGWAQIESLKPSGGWISMNCSNTPTLTPCATVNYKVVQDASGVFSGWAWSDEFGWISFNCSDLGTCATVNYGVTINQTTGDWQGWAWSENIGWISVNCAEPGTCATVAYKVSIGALGAPTVSSPIIGNNPQITLGGKSIIVNGTNFVSGATVSVGGFSATSVVFVNATQLTANAPIRSWTAGTYNVVVTNPDTQTGSCTNCMTFIAPPTVSSVTPNSNLNTAGGETVTVNGTGIKVGTNGVEVDPGNNLFATTFGTSSSVTFVTPAHAVATVVLRVYGDQGTVANGIYIDYSFITYGAVVNYPATTPKLISPVEACNITLTNGATCIAQITRGAQSTILSTGTFRGVKRAIQTIY